MKTLTWTTEEEAKVLIGKKVKMSDTGIRRWGDQAGGRTGIIKRITLNCWANVSWDGGCSNTYCSGDLLLAEPEALLLDKIAVRVENEEESRAVQERFFALGAKWYSHGAEINNSVGCNGFPAALLIDVSNCCENRLAWDDEPWAQSTIFRSTFSASVFLRDYPAPGEPKYPYLRDWKPGERVRHSAQDYAGNVGTVMRPGEAGDYPEGWFNQLSGWVPVRWDTSLQGRYCWGMNERGLTRLSDSGNGTEWKMTLGAGGVASNGTFKIWQGQADVIAALEDKPGEHDPLTDTRTRDEALRDLGRCGRWTHPRLPWFGDRR